MEDPAKDSVEDPAEDSAEDPEEERTQRRLQENHDLVALPSREREENIESYLSLPCEHWDFSFLPSSPSKLHSHGSRFYFLKFWLYTGIGNRGKRVFNVVFYADPTVAGCSVDLTLVSPVDLGLH